MTVHLRFELKEDLDSQSDDALNGEEIQVQPIEVEVIEQVTLGRGEDEVLTKQRADMSDESEFNRQMALLKNPHVDLAPFFAHERGVSRKHARLKVHNMRLTVADLGSTNGTYVNNEKLEPNMEYPIKEGDELRLGFLTVTFTII